VSVFSCVCVIRARMARWDISHCMQNSGLRDRTNLLRPFGAGGGDDSFHGLRCAAPVATFRHPWRGGESSFRVGRPGSQPIDPEYQNKDRQGEDDPLDIGEDGYTCGVDAHLRHRHDLGHQRSGNDGKDATDNWHQ
jgi:hypothetical protein